VLTLQSGAIQYLMSMIAKLQRTLNSRKGTKLHFKSPTAGRRHVLCVGHFGVGGDRTDAPRPGGAGVMMFEIDFKKKLKLSIIDLVIQEVKTSDKKQHGRQIRSRQARSRSCW
jgi:hypothetical protein